MTLQDQVLKMIETRGISQIAVARSLAVSAARLNQWLKGTYKGNIEEMNDRAKGWLERETAKAAAPRATIPFRPTTTARKVWEVAKLCHLDGEIGVVVGEAGLGKTCAVREYVAQNGGTLLIEADHGYTAKALFQELCSRLGLEPGKQLHPMLEAVVDKLRGSGRLVIIDEAEHLPYKALELLRRVHDKAGVGLLLVGMPVLYRNIKGKAVDFAQLYSRVGVYATLQPMTADDVALLVTAVYPAANGLCDVYAQNANGNARRLSKLLARAARVAALNGVAIDRHVVEAATKMLIA